MNQENAWPTLVLTLSMPSRTFCIGERSRCGGERGPAAR